MDKDACVARLDIFCTHSIQSGEAGLICYALQYTTCQTKRKQQNAD